MKSLTHHILVYDADCPMCLAYTKLFVTTGMLEPEGRQAYQHIPQWVYHLLDAERAKDEIALVNTENGKVYYGPESLLIVLSTNFPFLRLLYNLLPLRWLVRHLYALVSFNRKLIVPVNACSHARSCTPAFNLFYRGLYLFLSWMFVSWVLFHYSYRLHGLLPASRFSREWFICGGQIVFQSAFLFLLRTDTQTRWDYLGNMMTVSLGGALLLLPFLAVSHFISLPAYAALGWFMAVVGLMLLEHLRRCALLGLGKLVSASWVVYRFLILAILL